MQHATLTQVREGRGGRMVEIEEDVLDICRRIQEIEPSLGVDYNEDGQYFRIYQLIRGEKHTVTTTTELTSELVERIRRLAHPSYDFAGELERLDDEGTRQRRQAFREKVGEVGEELYHAMRKDLQVKDRIWLPRGIED
jgi:hypothetical protein